jgi:hypothetical protein
VRERGIFERRGKCKDRFLVRKKPSGRDKSIYGLEKAVTKIEKIFSESILFVRKPMDKHNIGIDRNFSLSHFFWSKKAQCKYYPMQGCPIAISC